MNELLRRLLRGAVYAPPDTGQGGLAGGEGGAGGTGGDAAAVAAAAAAAEAAKAAADKAAGEWKPPASKADYDKAVGDAVTAATATAVKTATEEAAKKASTAWRDAITDEAQKNTAIRFNSPGEMAAAINTLRTEHQKLVKPLTANATAEERAAWNKAMEVPEKPEDYGYKVPPIPDGEFSAAMKIGDKEIAVTTDDAALVNMTLPILQKQGVPKAQVHAVLNEVIQMNSDLRTKAMAQIEKTRDESEAALRKEWAGEDYKTNINLATRVAKGEVGGVSKDFIDLLDTPIPGGLLGDHPAMIRVLAAIGRANSEAGLLASGSGAAEASKTAQEQLDALNAKIPPGTAGYTDPAHQKTLAALYAKAYGNAPIVGAGRAF